MEQYAYYLDIKFSNIENAVEFYEETSNLIEWLSEYYDDSKVDLPNFYNQNLEKENLIKEILEEIELWENNDLPVVQLNDNLTVKTYTEAFAIFLSEIAEKYGIEEIDLQELISDDDTNMESAFDDSEDDEDEYSTSNEEFYDDNSFNELNDY
jgi:hypothetical protein